MTHPTNPLLPPDDDQRRLTAVWIGLGSLALWLAVLTSTC